MEPSSQKKQLILLVFGGLVAVALVAAHYGSSVSKKLSSNSDMEIILLTQDRPMLFIYHPFSHTVNIVRLHGRPPKTNGSAYQRACLAMGFFARPLPADGTLIPYIEADTLDLSVVSKLIGEWRASPAIIIRILVFLRDIKRSDATNLSWHDLALLVLELSRLNANSFIISDLPRDYFEANRSETVVPTGPVLRQADEAPASQTIRVQVLNASGRKGVAVLVTKYLRAKGFDVIDFGNFKTVEKQTKIVNCSDDIEAARRVRAALGLNSLEIYSKLDNMSIAQTRVVLGEDFDESKASLISFLKR